MSKPIENFVTRLSSILGPHDRASTPALLKELHVHLGRFSDAELQEAATILFETQKTNKFWPAFGAMTAAAQEARTRLSKAKYPHARPVSWDQRAKVDSDAKDWAAHWLATNEIGRQALLEGWGRTLQKLLVQKYDMNVRYGQPSLENIEFQPNEISYFRKYSKPLNPRLDFWVMFGKHDGEAWYAKYCEATGVSK